MIEIQEVSASWVQSNLVEDFISTVGHEGTAKLFSSILDTEIKTNRVSLEIQPGDLLIVGQYSGPRLEEGAMSLPEGAKIKWMLINTWVINQPKGV
jgi:hypothetical protein